MNLHSEICPHHLNEQPIVDLSLDGVQESNSSNTSLDIYSISFKQCRNIYPLKIIRPINRFKYDEQSELRDLISDLNINGVVIDSGIFDNLKRSVVRAAKSSAATHPCEYCEISAVRYKNDSMTRHKLTFPPQTMNGRPRTITGINRIVTSIEEEDEEVLCSEYVKGIKGRSVFLGQPNFDFIIDLPAEYMHLVCIGVVKRMVEFSYKVGKKKNRVTKRKRCDPKLFNDLIKDVLVPRESSRRIRNLDTSVFKAQEYRNILLFYFPIILQNIDAKYKKERQLWLALVFMITSCVIPNEEFENVKKELIVKACELFYNLYYELFGQENCIYSVHVLPSHLLKIRGNSPLTERSAFKFESFHAEMKNLFHSGTRSPIKQILRNTMMKRQLEYHCCQKSIKYTTQKNNKENISLVYLYTNNEYQFYEIQKIEGDIFTCKRQGKFNYKSTLLPNYDWKSIGIFKQGPIGVETYQINKNEIKGKVLSVLNVLVTCPTNVLTEQ